MPTVEPGTLYMVSTPIGNLGDFTFRAVEVLSGVDCVYAEDTRVSRVLLQRYSIGTPIQSYREAADRNVVERTIRQIADRLHDGESVAYVSDAGTPGVSDPGTYLVERIAAQGFPVVPIPGASALPAILSASGLPVQRPLFVGFLPKKKGHQTLMSRLRDGLALQAYDGLVFYESPERIIKLLEELLEWDMPLALCLGRELTKLHEEMVRGSLAEVLADLRGRSVIKGEIVLLVHNAS